MCENSVTSSVERSCVFAECLVESSLRACGPLYILAALGLISTVTYTFFFVLLVDMDPLYGRWAILAFKGTAVILLFCTLFNYWMCVSTLPGSTFDVSESVLYAHHRSAGWRFCQICDRPKPDLAHHCSVCNRCILRMDHHCPWVGNCVGFRNYRYFYLFLFYVTTSCVYGFVVMHKHSSVFLNPRRSEFLPVFTFMLSAAIGVAVGGLFLWHTFLIATGQGTIDFIDNFKEWTRAYREGRRWTNPHNLGFAQNFKNVFDVQGSFWWLLWLLPSIKKKAGNGIYTPGLSHLEDV